MKIIIAEDENVMSQMLKDFLEMMGHETYVANNGELAWNYWQEHKTDLLISDINMPYLNGLKLLDRIKKKDPKYPVIIITGVNIDDIHHEKTLEQAFGFLSKPFKLKKLMGFIDQIQI